MQVAVESTSELNRKMTVSVPEDKIRQQVESRLQSLAHKVKVDGFRPGKVPNAVVRKRYGQQVREEVLTDLIQSTFHDALRDEQLKPAGAPQIKAIKADEGEGLEYEASFEIMPEFVPMPLETLEVRRFVSSVEDADIDRMVEQLREQRKTWLEVERLAEKGDRVTIAFEGTHEGEAFTQGRVENFTVVLGSGYMIPGFEDQLIGQAVGAAIEFDLQFPAEYPTEKLANQTGHFVVEISKIEEPQLPALDAEFARQFGIEDGDMAALREDIRVNMEREMNRALKSRAKSSVMDELYNKNTLELPKVLVQDELNDLAKPYRESASKNKQPLDEDTLKSNLEPLAKRRVALSLILGKLIDVYGVKLDPGRVRAAVEDLAASYEHPAEVVRWYYAEPTRLREIENMVFEDQVVDLIFEKAISSDVNLPFQTLMAGALSAPSASQPA